MNDNWVTVCDLDDISPDTGVCALFNQSQVAIFRLSGSDRVFAIGNYDPFGKANVLSRGMLADLKGEITVASPLYKQHFSLVTGQCLEDPDTSVPVYRVRVKDRRVELAV